MVYLDSSEAGLTVGLTVRRGLGRIGAGKGGQSAEAFETVCGLGSMAILAPPAIEAERQTSTLSRRKQGFESLCARQINQ
jgi:hypothetical protein